MNSYLDNRSTHRRPPIPHAALNHNNYYNNHSMNFSGTVNGLPLPQSKFRDSGHEKENLIVKSFVNTMRTFCKETSLHGLRNVSESVHEFKVAKSR